eukprot:TRINITY_DN5003_c0_g1_i1.p1 TRINITY_DN5003_c0_g1~~TRINITY_DN5003_c0_g1_i1.p1  ORF type:complete len:563 (+),score=181.75 TRINITY_DN5003_c0_g1_i1:169-1857(+)
MEFSPSELLQVETVVSVGSSRLYSVLLSIMDACNAQFRAAAAGSEEMRKRVDDLEGRAAEAEAILSKISVEAEEERESRIAKLEIRADEHADSLELERERREAADEAIRASIAEQSSRAGATEARLEVVERAGLEATETAARVTRLERELGRTDAALEALSGSHDQAAESLAGLYAVLGADAAAVQEVVAADRAESAGGELCCDHVLGWPPFAAIRRELESRHAAALAAIDLLRADQDSAIIETRGRIVDKLDKKLFEGWRPRADDVMENLRSDIEQLRRRADTLQDCKSEESSVERRFQEMHMAKANKTDMHEYATRTDLTRTTSAMDELHSEVTSLWERLERAPQKRHSSASRSRSPSVAVQNKGDHRGSMTLALTNAIEALKLRASSVELRVDGHDGDVTRLTECKMDKKDLKELYGFLDKVTQRVDQLAAAAAATPPPSAPPPGGSSGGQPTPQPPAVLQPQRPVSAPAARPSVSVTRQSLHSHRESVELPSIGARERAAVTESERPAGGGSPGRDHSPQRGNTRWGGGATFVRGSDGVMWTSASRTGPTVRTVEAQA